MVFCYGNLKMTKTGIYYILSKKSSKLVAINSMGFFNKYMKKQYEIMQTLVKFLNLEVKGKNTNIYFMSKSGEKQIIVSFRDHRFH